MSGSPLKTVHKADELLFCCLRQLPTVVTQHNANASKQSQVTHHAENQLQSASHGAFTLNCQTLAPAKTLQRISPLLRVVAVSLWLQRKQYKFSTLVISA
eukprot:766437-Rhodomonas_salina.3